MTLQLINHTSDFSNLANDLLQYYNKQLNTGVEKQSLIKDNELKDYASDYLKHNSKINLENFDKIATPLEFQNLKFEDSNSEEKYESYKNLSLLLYYIKNILLGYNSETEKEFKGLTRMVAPPLEAYSDIGHNKLDIKESKKAYSLTYE